MAARRVEIFGGRVPLVIASPGGASGVVIAPHLAADLGGVGQYQPLQIVRERTICRIHQLLHRPSIRKTRAYPVNADTHYM